jgi:cytochrome c
VAFIDPCQYCLPSTVQDEFQSLRRLLSPPANHEGSVPTIRRKLQLMSRMLDALVRMAISSALAMLFNTAWGAGTPPQELLEKYRCTTCHAKSDAAAGPAWVDIATHYRREHGADKIVADKIRSGVRGSGPWHMPPHPEVSRADATTMARYILSTRTGPMDK